MDLINQIFDNSLILKLILQKLTLHDLERNAQNVNSEWRKVSEIVIREKSLNFSSYSSFINFIRWNSNVESEFETLSIFMGEETSIRDILSSQDYPYLLKWLRLNGPRIRSLHLDGIEGCIADKGCSELEYSRLAEIMYHFHNLKEFGIFGYLDSEKTHPPVENPVAFLEPPNPLPSCPGNINSVKKIILGLRCSESFLQVHGVAFGILLVEAFPAVEFWSFSNKLSCPEGIVSHDLSFAIFNQMMGAENLQKFSNLNTLHFKWDESKCFALSLYLFFFAADEILEKVDNLIITNFYSVNRSSTTRNQNKHLSLLLFIIRKLRNNLKRFRMDVKQQNEDENDFLLFLAKPMEKLEQLRIMFEEHDGRKKRLQLESVPQSLLIKYRNGELEAEFSD